MKKPLIILTGPTAVGKTALSIDLALRVNGEIISADSMQVYKQMNIGTAKILPEEMGGINHYLVDELDPDQDFNVVSFKKLAQKYMDVIYAKGKIPIIVGGTGFYIQAVLYDIDFEEHDADLSYRKELEDLVQQNGNEYLHAMLREVDLASSVTIHPNNSKRVIRALEYYKKNETPISKHNQEQSNKTSPYNSAYFVLNTDRNILYERIDKRVEDMIALGLVDEVTDLLKKGYTKNLVSMQGLGYKEIIAYLNQEYDLEETKYIIKRDTRHFAKRQLTWFKREKDVIWINKPEYQSEENVLDAMLLELKNRNILS